MRTEEWDKASTIQNMNINLPRKSMRGIVLLFKNKTLSDGEKFVHPNVDRVKLTIEGVSNEVFSQRIPGQLQGAGAR